VRRKQKQTEEYFDGLSTNGIYFRPRELDFPPFALSLSKGSDPKKRARRGAAKFSRARFGRAQG
jgi:hypothetical protein